MLWFSAYIYSWLNPNVAIYTAGADGLNDIEIMQNSNGVLYKSMLAIELS